MCNEYTHMLTQCSLMAAGLQLQHSWVNGWTEQLCLKTTQRLMFNGEEKKPCRFLWPCFFYGKLGDYGKASI